MAATKRTDLPDADTSGQIPTWGVAHDKPNISGGGDSKVIAAPACRLGLARRVGFAVVARAYEISFRNENSPPEVEIARPRTSIG